VAPHHAIIAETGPPLAMRRESLILGLAVVCSMAIMGWIIWAERPVPPVPSAVAPTDTPADEVQMLPLDDARVAELMSAAEADAEDLDARVSLAALYFGAQRFAQAIPWFEEALTLTPDNVEASTNLGISYYYVGSPERAVGQLERSLEIDPTHAQTLVSLGLVKAFGLQDLEGATAAWERALEVAPDSPEARAAREAINRLQAAHENTDVGSQASGVDAP
jgi:tetratricopeptide (TPR) repeat protein